MVSFSSVGGSDSVAVVVVIVVAVVGVVVMVVVVVVVVVTKWHCRGVVTTFIRVAVVIVVGELY